ncbi:hypothetical protein MHI22_05435 [Lysinibacillus sp. FSL L8-0312]|uniref:hypothetical protein n=1 Tax=Lysinibacillus sp. FSL L8-0312 TaxID=2921521 RepID=UPI0030FC2A32
MMKIGSAEWFKQLSETKFPSYFAFYYLQKADTRTIAVKIVDSKAKDAEGIKYGALEPTIGMYFSGNNIALVDVAMVFDANQYYEKVKKVAETWGIEIIDEKDKSA